MPANTNDIIRLLNKLGVKEDPVIVPVQPEIYAQLHECYFNVMEKVRRDGGHLHCGWHISPYGRFIVEAERHAVWEDDKGNLIDISPSEIHEEKILFVSDKTDDIDLCMKTDNVRLNITNNKVVDDFISLCETF